MGAVVFAFANKSPAPRRPWQNHELAEFYRAIDILGRAGLVVAPDMGVSDEGDPWFAFCRDDTGDVIVHFARIDGLLIAASVASIGVVRGAELRNVIDAVTRLQPLSLPVTVTVTDRRLFLHPAVVLTAFIAAALAFSKHANAHEQHANATITGSESHALVTKMLLTLKGTASDAFGLAAPSASGGNASLELAGSDGTMSLAALLSAAMSVVGPALSNADDSTALTNAVYHPPTQTDEHSSLGALTALISSPLSSGALSDVSARSHDLSSETSIVAPHWDGVLNATSLSSIVIVPIASSDLSQITLLPAPQAQAPFAGIAENVFGPVAGPSPHIGTMSAASSAGSGALESSAAFDPTHSLDLSTISAVALSVLLGSSWTAPTYTSAASDATPTLGNSGAAPAPSVANALTSSDVIGSATSSLTVTGAATVGTTISAPISPTTIVIASNPVAALNELVDYGLTNHPLNGNLVVSSALAASLPAYTAEVTQPVRLIVFDSSAISLPVFELTKGVVFVSDSELGVTPAQEPAANIVTVDLASGGTMTLLGVVDTAHLNPHL